MIVAIDNSLPKPTALGKPSNMIVLRDTQPGLTQVEALVATLTFEEAAGLMVQLSHIMADHISH